MAGVLTLMGNEVLTAYDGDEAIEAAKEFRPEIILMDVGIPRLNGYEAVRRIREQPWGRDARIDEQGRQQSKEAGCDDDLVKPVSFPDLEKLLARFARRVPRRSQ